MFGMGLYHKIIEASAAVDERFARLTPRELGGYEILYPVPPGHTRASEISVYQLKVGSFEIFPRRLSGNDRCVWLVDSAVAGLRFVSEVLEKLPQSHEIHILTPREDETKELSFLGKFIRENGLHAGPGKMAVIGVGGGIICNAAAFVAEAVRGGLWLAATTPIAMADICGGKVRANRVGVGGGTKHHYKSFYEPDFILADPRFLDTLPEAVIRAALPEIVKQGIFQSSALLEYVLSDSFRPFSRRGNLLKAVIWAADLKRVCIEHDPEESADGARIILRAGHDISDRLEERLSFAVPHGYAVAVGIIRQLEEQNDRRAAVGRAAFVRFGIPATESELIAGYKTHGFQNALALRHAGR